MKPKDYTDEFLIRLNLFQENKKGLEYRNLSNYFNKGIQSAQLIKDLNIKGFSFQGVIFEAFVFENCKFIDCNFFNSSISNCTFTKCLFEDCTFTNLISVDVSFHNSSFVDCRINGSTFYSNEFVKSVFLRLTMVETNLEIEDRVDVKFKDSNINTVQFLSKYIDDVHSLGFSNCDLSSCHFRHINFQHSFLEESYLHLTSFSNCKVLRNTFQSCEAIGEEYNYIDFQSIIKSDFSADTLLKVFGINEPDIKGYIYGVVSKVEFNTVFISYSFKDKVVVKRIENALAARGVITFLWEKDAPAGKKLKDIMATNINTYDKMLFVASENSLKSEACHFELTEARLKHERTWEDVIVPISLDQFFYKLKDYNIPESQESTFLPNIKALRKINVLDFSMFNNDAFDLIEFNEKIEKLIKALRKETAK